MLFHLKNMKYSEALPMFLIWRENVYFHMTKCGVFFLHAQHVKGCDSHEKNIHKVLLDLFTE